MKGVALMRDAAVLAAECAVATPVDQMLTADAGWAVHPERRAALAQRLQAHLDDDDRLLRRVRDELGLDAGSYWLVMLCVAVELYPEAAAAVSLVAEDARVQLVTPTVHARLMQGIAGVAFAEALVTALDGGAARRMGLLELVEPVPGQPRSHHALRLVSAELGELLGEAGALGHAHDVHTHRLPPAAHTVFAPTRVQGAASLLGRRGLLCLRTRSRRAGRQLAHDVATARGEAVLLFVPVDELPAAEALMRLAEGLVAIDLVQHPSGAAPPTGWLHRLEGARRDFVVLVPSAAEAGQVATIEVGRIGRAEAQRAWSTQLPAPEASAMADRFHVGVEEVSSVLCEAEDERAVERGEAVPPGDAPRLGAAALAARVLARGARRMGRQVDVLARGPGLDQLVVPWALRQQLDEIVAWYAAAPRVWREMGMGQGPDSGTGLTCLFGGKPGTGKTFAARCLATTLGLNLYRIDLSQVVSKYIGETEKALAAVFDEVEVGHGVLLFDEADALFGKRSEVKDAHDRYANIEVGYLLQRLESFDGVAILTTNLRGNIDAAFARRLRFVLEFPMPDRVLRRQLWDQALPAAPWRSPDLALEELADRFQLAGGSIHNIGLAAAHFAAAEPSGQLTNEHLLRATLRELDKTGRPSGPEVFGSLAHLHPEARR